MAVSDALRWLPRLSKKLEDRRGELDQYDNYYEGYHPLEYASAKFRRVFGGIFDEFADNWCPVVADAPEERLNVIGFRFGDDPAADEDANRFWQANQMDARSQMLHTEALVHGTAAVTVWNDHPRDDVPSIDVEHPLQVIVATDPSNPRRRLAALKQWTDEWTGQQHATVYLPDGLYKFRKQKSRRNSGLVVIRSGRDAGREWVRRDVDETGDDAWPVDNPLGVVPVVPLRNKQRMLKPGRSEIRNVIPLQNAVNKLITDMMVASELGAMPGRWATGWGDLKDPETGEDLTPNITDYLEKFVTAPEPDTGFGTFDQATLDPFVKAIEMVVLHIAAQSRTPRHYLIQQGQSPSGDALRSAESGLVSKTRTKQTFWGEDYEEVIRLGFAVLDDPRATVVNAETMWRDPEFRTESQHIDALAKKATQLGVPRRQVWEDAGYTPAQIRRFEKFRQREALEAGMFQVNNNGQAQGDGELSASVSAG